MYDVNLESVHRVEGKDISEAVCCVRGTQNHMEEAAPVQGGMLGIKKATVML